MSNLQESSDRIGDQRLAQIGLECLEHLEKEKASLKAFLEHALAVQDAVINGEGIDPQQNEQRQQQLEQDAQMLAETRSKLKTKIAMLFDQPVATVTMKSLAAVLDQNLAGKVLESREQILELTRAIENTNRTNFLLIQQTIDLQRRLHSAITGEAPVTNTYGASGQLNKSNDQSLLETEC